MKLADGQRYLERKKKNAPSLVPVHGSGYERGILGTNLTFALVHKVAALLFEPTTSTLID